MRIKTSITLPAKLLGRIDQVESNRSAFIERAARAYLGTLNRPERDAKDTALINSKADQLNVEAMDTLEYQDLS